jgi:phospholipid transport system substrate-binding protein
MRRILVTGFAVFAGFAGWASPADVRQPVPANLPVTGPTALAPEPAPDVLVKTVTSEVIAIIRQDKDFQAGNPAKVADLVETRILPHFDFARMTQIAVARNWRLATPEQQQALITEFKTLLVRTYSTALSGYRDQAIEYKPLRAAPDATEVTVRSDVQQSGRERMTIDYDMEKTPAGWKVYDIKIAGVSMVTTYRDTFAGRVRDGGIEGLIKSLSDKNRQGDARFRSHRTSHISHSA